LGKPTYTLFKIPLLPKEGIKGRADASRNINKVLPIFAENYLVAFSQLTEKYSK
jgi:hypothetical protein